MLIEGFCGYRGTKLAQQVWKIAQTASAHFSNHGIVHIFPCFLRAVSKSARGSEYKHLWAQIQSWTKLDLHHLRQASLKVKPHLECWLFLTSYHSHSQERGCTKCVLKPTQRLSLILMKANSLMLSTRCQDSDFSSPAIDGIEWLYNDMYSMCTTLFFSW